MNPATIEHVVADYEAGASSLRLAEHYGISKASVLRLQREQGVVIRHQSLTHEEAAEATRLYQQGLSLARVGKHLGREASMIHVTLRRAGVAIRDSHGRNR